MSSRLILDSGHFFATMVNEAFEERKLQSYPHIRTYLTDVLKHHLFVENLFDEEDQSGKKVRKTMAELFLSANQNGGRTRVEGLKKVGDRSLYISGFLGDSLQRKIIDVDYYMDIGKMAFGSLAKDVEEDTFSKLFRDISDQFVNLVDVFTLISKKAKMTDDENILRLMDLYSKTGSSLVGETLAEKGYFNLPNKKINQQ